MITVILSVLPILVLLVGIGLLNKTTVLISPIGWVVALLLGLSSFSMSVTVGWQNSLLGGLNGFALIWIIFPILFLYQILNYIGSLDALKKAISNLTDDHFIQVALLGFGFVLFINGVAGFGSSGALAATMLTGLGLSPVMAGAMVLLGVTPGTYTGSLGFSALATSKAFNIPIGTLTHYWAGQMPWWALLTPLVLAWFLGGKAGLRKNWLSALVLGLGGAFGMWLALVYGYYQLVDISGGLFAMLFGLIYVRMRKTSKATDLAAKLTSEEKFKAFFPFIFLLTIVIITQAVPSINTVLKKYVVTWTIAKNAVFKFDYLNQPGIWVLITVLVLALIFKVNSQQASKLFIKAIKQSWRPAVALGFVMAMAQVMSASGMNLVLAKTVAGALGVGYIFFLPLVSAIGTYAGGNSTASTMMLAPFHMAYAKLIGIDPILLLTLTAVAANVTNNIAPPKMVTVLSAVGGSGQDAEMLKKMMGPVGIYLVITTILVAVKVFL